MFIPKQESAEKFKDLTLDEVVNLLDNHNPDVKANAAGYLQHLAYKNDENKNDIRHCGGIPKLIDILDDRNDDPRVVGKSKFNNLHIQKYYFKIFRKHNRRFAKHKLWP